MFFFFIFVLPFFFYSLPTPAPYFQPSKTPFVIAHRGASGYLPESTLESIAISLYGNADFTEFDVVVTKDRELLIMHDPNLGRVTNVEEFPEFKPRKKNRIVDGKNIFDYFVDDFSLAEIKQLSIKQNLFPGRLSIFDFKFKAPTLDEFLKFVIQFNRNKIKKDINAKIIGAFIEAKNGDMYKKIFGPEFEIGQLLINKLRDYGLDNFENATRLCPIVLQSFPIETTIYFHKSGNNLPRIQLVNDGLYNYKLEEISKIAHGIGTNFNLILESFYPLRKNDYIQKAQELGLLVFPYTFRDDDIAFGKDNIDMYRIAAEYLKVNGVFSEFFEAALTYYNSIKNEF